MSFLKTLSKIMQSTPLYCHAAILQYKVCIILIRLRGHVMMYQSSIGHFTGHKFAEFTKFEFWNAWSEICMNSYSALMLAFNWKNNDCFQTVSQTFPSFCDWLAIRAAPPLI